MAGLRADARRNRERILTVAAEVFANEGLSVSVHEVARRAGVGTGTVSRHFPTKEDLFEAILRQRMHDLVTFADALLAGPDAGAGFFAFFEATMTAGATDRGFAERLSMAAGERDAIGRETQVLCDRLEALLVRAQRAGAVRPDIGLADVEALMTACMSRPASLPALSDVVRRGLAVAGPGHV